MKFLTIAGYYFLLAFCSVSANDIDPSLTSPDSLVVSDFDTIQAAAIVDYDSTRVVIRDNGQADVISKTRVRILRESGREYGELQFFENSLVKVDKFVAYAYSAAGVEILKRTKKELRKDCGFGASYELYSDICMLSVSLNAGNYPITIEYESTVKMLSLFAWPLWQPQLNIPVNNSSYVVDAPRDFEYRSNSKNLDETSKQPSQLLGNRKIDSWFAARIPAFDREPQSPPKFELMPRLDFCAGKSLLGNYPLDASSWHTLAQSYFEIARKQLRIEGRLADEARTMFGDSQEPALQLEKLHESLMARQRYVAISIGIGGWQPHAAVDTYANRYGDCKDLSTLYVGLLQHSGYPAFLALIRTKDQGIIDPTFPTLSNFNHAIVMFLNGNDTLWADPTCTTCRFGDIPDEVEDTYALIIDPVAGNLVRTPLSAAGENFVKRNLTVKMSADNSAALVLDIDASGNPSHSLKYAAQNLTNDNFRDYLLRSDILPNGLIIDACTITSHDSDLSRFSCQVSGRIRRAGRQVDNRVVLSSTILPSLVSFEPFDISDRIAPLLRGSTLTVNDQIQVEIPAGWKISELPKPRSAAGRFGHFAVSADSTAGIKLTRSYASVTTRIERSDFEEFDAYRDSCAKALNLNVILRKK